MKMRAMMGSLLVGTLVLTSVPLANLSGGGLIAKAAGTTSYHKLETGDVQADSQQAGDEPITQAFDENPSTSWNTKWGRISGGNGAEGNWNQTGGYWELTGRNTVTIPLKTTSEVGYIEYVGRNNHNEGLVRTMKVLVKKENSDVFEEVQGQHLGEDGGQVSEWPKQQSKTFKYQLLQPATGVETVRLVFTSSYSNNASAGGNAPGECHISAAELRVYGAETLATGTHIENASVSLNAKPEAGQTIGSFVADDAGAYTVNSATWTGKSDGVVDTEYARYEKYGIELSLVANGNNVFTLDTQVKAVIDGQDIPFTVTGLSNEGKGATATADYNGLSVSSVRYIDEDGDGKISIPEEDMAFFNLLENITVEMLVKYNDVPQEKKIYSMFTLDAGGGDHLTFWHQPLTTKGLGAAYYAYKGSGAGLTYGRITAKVADTKWHKIVWSAGQNGGSKKGTFSMDGVAADFSHSITDMGPLTTPSFKNAYVGTPAPQGDYGTSNVNNAESKPNNEFPGMVKYIEIFDTANDVATQGNKTHSESSEELGKVKSEAEKMDEDDYKRDSWTAFTEYKNNDDVKNAETDGANVKDWTACNAADAINESLSKLEVCYHTYLNGECTICGSTYRAGTGEAGEGVVSPSPVTMFEVQTRENESGDVKSENVNYGTVCSVTAGEPQTAGRLFSHWSSDEAGLNILSRNTRYDFYVSKGMTVYANFAESPQASEPCIANNNAYAKIVGTANSVYFEFTRDVPSDWTMVEHGVLYGTSASKFSTDADTSLQFTDEQGSDVKEGVTKKVGESASRRGVYILTLNVGGRTDGVVYSRGYVIATNKNGDTKVFYSPVAKGSFDELATSGQ